MTRRAELWTTVAEPAVDTRPQAVNNTVDTHIAVTRPSRSPPAHSSAAERDTTRSPKPVETVDNVIHNCGQRRRCTSSTNLHHRPSKVFGLWTCGFIIIPAVPREQS